MFPSPKSQENVDGELPVWSVKETDNPLGTAKNEAAGCGQVTIKNWHEVLVLHELVTVRQTL